MPELTPTPTITHDATPVTDGAGRRMIRLYTSDHRYIGCVTVDMLTEQEALSYAKAFATVPNPLQQPNEEAAATFREHSRAGDGKPEGTRESLATCASMLNEHAADLYPANENGQIHFARGLMESAADEITAFLAKDASADLLAACEEALKLMPHAHQHACTLDPRADGDTSEPSQFSMCGERLKLAIAKAKGVA